MKRSLPACALALAALTGTLPAMAATPTPAHWSIQHPPARPVAPGATFSLTLAAEIQPGWHLYALEEPEGPIATVVGLAEGDPLTLLDVNEPDPHKVPDPLTHTVAGVFTSSVGFTLKLRTPQSRPAPGSTSHILVRYQSCNDQVCLPPHTETVVLPLNGLLK